MTAQKGASLHDQPVGPQVAEEAVFDWLDDQLGFCPSAKGSDRIAA